MGRKARGGKHIITWEQFKAFAVACDRDVTHALRVFKGERSSESLKADFAAHFGFRMENAALAGQRSRRKAAA